MFRLETDRLFIRPWTPADRPAFTGLTEDPEVMRYVHGGQPYAEDEVDEWFTRQARQLAEHDVCMGALIEKATGRLVGIAGTQPLGTTGNLEIGWWLARDVWGRGYATEAGGAAMRHVLETLGHKRVVAIIDPDNEPSKRVVGRLGMHYESRVTGEQLGVCAAENAWKVGKMMHADQLPNVPAGAELLAPAIAERLAAREASGVLHL